MPKYEIWDKLFRAHQGDVYKYAKWLTEHREDWADDIVQETFLRAMLALENDVETVREMVPFLKRVARNAFIDSTRGIAARDAENISLEIFVEGRHSRVSSAATDDEIETKFEHQAILDAIEQLGVEYRETAKLRFIDEMPYEEIVEQLGITMPALKSRLHRARMILAMSAE